MEPILTMSILSGSVSSLASVGLPTHVFVHLFNNLRNLRLVIDCSSSYFVGLS